jgi:hypothetical protein
VKVGVRAVQVCCTVSLGISASHAEDASIDKLLSKLPPPEKIIQPSARKALERSDPAFKDSLTKQIVVAVRTWNFQQALGLSRKLTQRYPRSAGAQCLRGALAYDLRQFAEASAAFRTATNIDLKYPFAYFGLAAVEATQGAVCCRCPSSSAGAKTPTQCRRCVLCPQRLRISPGQERRERDLCSERSRSGSIGRLHVVATSQGRKISRAHRRDFECNSKSSPGFAGQRDDARGPWVQLHQCESHSTGDSSASTGGETSASQLPGAITAWVLPYDRRSNGCSNRIFTQRRKLKF